MRDFSQTKSTHSHRKRINPGRIFLTIFIFILVTLPVYSFFYKTKPVNKPATDDHQKASSEVFPLLATKKSLTSLLKEIENISENATGSYSVYVVDLKGKKSFGINEKVIYTGASINKLAILATLYHLAGRNEVDLEKIIVPQEEDIQDYGSGSIRYDPPGTPYSIKTLARLMMEKSDNTASYILATHIIGMEKIQLLTDSLNMSQTDMANNKTSCYDISILLAAMYEGKITNSAYTAEMLSFMDKTDFDDRIPRGLPEGTRYFHKTGDETGRLHDAAIIELPGKPYYLGIFTSDITDEEKTKSNMSEISRLVYDYMK